MQQIYMTDIDEEILMNGSPDEKREVAAELHRTAEFFANAYNEPVEIRFLNQPFIQKQPGLNRRQS